MIFFRHLCVYGNFPVCLKMFFFSNQVGSAAGHCIKDSQFYTPERFRNFSGYVF